VSGEVVEIWVEGLWLRYRTRNSLRTLRKIAEKGYSAYLRWESGWVHLLPEDVERLSRSESVVVPFFLEHPRFGGAKAHSHVTLTPEDLAVQRAQEEVRKE
jgi:hypothetical protein